MFRHVPTPHVQYEVIDPLTGEILASDVTRKNARIIVRHSDRWLRVRRARENTET